MEEEISAEERARRVSAAIERLMVSAEEVARRKSAAIERRMIAEQARKDWLIERSRVLELMLAEDRSDENMQRMIDFRNEIARLRLSGSSRQKQKEDADRMLEAIAGREEISAEERARRASRAQEMQTVSVEEMARRKSAAIERRIGEVQRRIDRLIERSRELELTLSEDPSDENMQRMIDFRNEIARLRLSQNSGQRQKENIENRVPIFVLWEG